MDESPEALLASVNLIEFGRRVRSTRVARGLTQEAVAGTEISGAYVSRIEAGQRRPEPARRAAAGRPTRHHAGLPGHRGGAAVRRGDPAGPALRRARAELRRGHRRRSPGPQAAPRRGERPRTVAPAKPSGSTPAAWRRSVRSRRPRPCSRPSSPTATRRCGCPRSSRLCRCYREAGDLSRSIDVGQDALRHLESLDLGGTEDAVRLAVSLVGAYFERGDELYALQLSRIHGEPGRAAGIADGARLGVLECQHHRGAARRAGRGDPPRRPRVDPDVGHR